MQAAAFRQELGQTILGPSPVPCKSVEYRQETDSWAITCKSVEYRQETERNCGRVCRNSLPLCATHESTDSYKLVLAAPVWFGILEYSARQSYGLCEGALVCQITVLEPAQGFRV